jgi:hypothetical protein
MTTNTTEKSETASASQNDGMEVTEYISPCGSHVEHENLLSLIEGKWLSLDAWQKLAEQKLGMDETKFAWLRDDLEATHCICHDEGLASALIIQIPVPPNWAEGT